MTIKFCTLLYTFGTMSLEIIVFLKTRPFGKYNLYLRLIIKPGDILL